LKRRSAAGLALRTATLLALAALMAKPVAADWLVTRAGTRVETRGAWQVKGKLVVFHTADGALSSLRLAEVDLDASGRATAQAVRARQTAESTAVPTARKAPVLVLTDDDVRHVGDGAAAPAAASLADPSFTVANWERSLDAGAGVVAITGTLQNTSGVSATEVTLAVQLLEAGGQVAATGQATLTSTVLSPGQRSGFRVVFPNAPTYSDVKFAPLGVGTPAKPEETEKEKETP
jgi:hypothetical protein